MARFQEGLWDKLQTKRVSYTWTAQNVIDGFANVPVVFDSPFPDMNFTVIFTPHDLEPTVSLDYYNGDAHAITESGFNAIVYAFSPGPDFSHAGDKLEINVIAIHD